MAQGCTYLTSLLQEQVIHNPLDASNRRWAVPGGRPDTLPQQALANVYNDLPIDRIGTPIPIPGSHSPACSFQGLGSTSSAASSGPPGSGSGTGSGSGSGSGSAALPRLASGGEALMMMPSASTPSRLSRCGQQDSQSHLQRGCLFDSKASGKFAQGHSLPLLPLHAGSPAVVMVSPFSLSSPQAPDALAVGAISPSIVYKQRPAAALRQLFGCSVGPRLASSRIMQKLLQQKGVSFTHPDVCAGDHGAASKATKGRALSWAGDNLVVARPYSWNEDHGSEPGSRGPTSASGLPGISSPLGPQGGGRTPSDTTLHYQRQAAVTHLDLLQQPEAKHASAPLPLLQDPTSPAGAFGVFVEHRQRPWEDALPQRRRASFFTLRDYPSKVQPLPHSAVVGPRLASARSLRLMQLGALGPGEAIYRGSVDFGTRHSEDSGPLSGLWPRSESGAGGGSCRGHCITNSAPSATAGHGTRHLPWRNVTDSQLVIPGLHHDDAQSHPPALSLPGGMLCTTLEEELGMLSGYGDIQT